MKKDKDSWSFCSDATFPIGDIKSVEIMLYPSEDQRDWSKFSAPWYKKERFDPKTLQPFDKVLVRDKYSRIWNIDIYSHKYTGTDIVDRAYPYICIGNGHRYCIPYNNDTKHLVETNEQEPEYYRYWED